MTLLTGSRWARTSYFTVGLSAMIFFLSFFCASQLNEADAHEAMRGSLLKSGPPGVAWCATPGGSMPLPLGVRGAYPQGSQAPCPPGVATSSSRDLHDSLCREVPARLAQVGVDSVEVYRKIVYAESMRRNRELRTRQDESRKIASKISLQ